MDMSVPFACPPWGEIDSDGLQETLPDGTTLHVVRTREGVLHGVAGDRGDEPKDLTIIAAEKKLFFTPLLPDKPVVLRPNHTLQIVPGNQLFVYIPVPLVPSLATWNQKRGFESLVSFSASNLSLTWFGDPVAGESAYSVNTPIDGTTDWKNENPWVGYCPLRIRNSSPEILTFQRMILRVPYLSMFSWSHGFTTNELTIVFRGRSQVSQIQIAKGAPDLDESMDLFRGPNQRKDSMILRRSFSIIKSLAQS